MSCHQQKCHFDFCEDNSLNIPGEIDLNEQYFNQDGKNVWINFNEDPVSKCALHNETDMSDVKELINQVEDTVAKAKKREYIVNVSM